MTDAKSLIDEAVSAVQALTDEGNQLHRRAVAGKRLIASMTAFDKTAFGGTGCYRVLLRIDGQYIDRAVAHVPVRSAADDLLSEVNRMLAETPPPVPSLEPGRPAEMEGGKRVNVYLDAESLAIAARMGNGNVSEGIRKALRAATSTEGE